MNPVKIVVPAILICFGSNACRKEATDLHPEMKGYWVSSAYGADYGSTLTINSSGKSTAHGQPCCGAGSESDYNGKAKISKDILYIGGYHNHIDGYPAYDATGNYGMNINGINYYTVMAPCSPAGATSNDSALFSWSYPPNLDGFNSNAGLTTTIDYRIMSTSAWTSTTVDFGQYHFNIGGLLPATVYEWRMMNTFNGSPSGYSAIQNFTTQ